VSVHRVKMLGLIAGWVLVLSCAVPTLGLELGRTFPAEIGSSNATVWCKTAQEISPRNCTMTLPDGTLLSLDLTTNEVMNGTEKLEGYSAYSDDEFTSCGLTVKKVTIEDLVEWKCTIKTASHNQYGYINLLNNEMGFVKKVRLPRHVNPVSYNLKLTAFIIADNYTIDGQLLMEANVNTTMISNDCENKCIKMHSRDTIIDEESIEISQNGSSKLEGVGYDKDREFLILYTKDALTDGPVTINMGFVSKLQDNLSGFYRSQYFDNLTNTTKMIATTQFESTDARRAFPCLDEPDMKATFTVGLGRKKNMKTLSNMEKDGDAVEIDGTYEMDMYKTSVKMSTYLLAFIVCEFDSFHVPEHPEFNVWAQKEKLSEVEYAAEIGPKIIDFYEEFFNTSFPLNKMDMAAIPDFGAGAMENWGLITYRDSAIMYDNVSYSLSNKARVAAVVAHELAHQWFGNLVTMKWWSDLWLNEGFASYIEYLGVDHVAPEMKLSEQILNNDFHDVLYLDSLPSSHPIKVDIENPTYQGNFDRISYGKGAVLIRMMDNFLTTESFRKGLANYFKTNEYANAEQDDLWFALGEQAHADGILSMDISVKDIMDTWTLQMGYPVLHINQVDGNWTLLQTKFNLELNITDTEEYLWSIPMSFRSLNELNNTAVNFWMHEKTATVPANETTEDLYIFNIGQMGYFRVNYAPEMWARLLDNTLFSKLSNLNRAQMFDDSLNLARAGILPYSTALEMTKHLTTEQDYTALVSARGGLKFIENMLKADKKWTNFQDYLMNVLQDVYNEASASQSTEFLDVQKKVLLNTWACRLKNQDCIDTARGEFSKWLAADDFEASVDPNFKYNVHCTGVEYGTTEDWNVAWERAQITTNSLERISLYYALGCTTNETQLEIYLEKSIDSNSNIRDQDVIYVYRSTGVNGGILALNWLNKNWDRVLSYFGEGFPGIIRNIINAYPETANTKEQYDVLAGLLDEHRGELASAVDAAEQALDKISANIKWRQQFYEEVVNWAEAPSPSSSCTHFSFVQLVYVVAIFIFMQYM